MVPDGTGLGPGALAGGVEATNQQVHGQRLDPTWVEAGSLLSDPCPLPGIFPGQKTNIFFPKLKEVSRQAHPWRRLPACWLQYLFLLLS